MQRYATTDGPPHRGEREQSAEAASKDGAQLEAELATRDALVDGGSSGSGAAAEGAAAAAAAAGERPPDAVVVEDATGAKDADVEAQLKALGFSEDEGGEDPEGFDAVSLSSSGGSGLLKAFCKRWRRLSSALLIGHCCQDGRRAWPLTTFCCLLVHPVQPANGWRFASQECSRLKHVAAAQMGDSAIVLGQRQLSTFSEIKHHGCCCRADDEAGEALLSSSDSDDEEEGGDELSALRKAAQREVAAQAAARQAGADGGTEGEGVLASIGRQMTVLEEIQQASKKRQRCVTHQPHRLPDPSLFMICPLPMIDTMYVCCMMYAASRRSKVRNDVSTVGAATRSGRRRRAILRYDNHSFTIYTSREHVLLLRAQVPAAAAAERARRHAAAAGGAAAAGDRRLFAQDCGREPHQQGRARRPRAGLLRPRRRRQPERVFCGF